MEALRNHPDSVLKRIFRMSVGAISIGVAGVLVLTLALYFLIDGARVRAAVLRLTPVAYRTRVDQTLTGTADVVRHYLIGRTIVSALFATFMFVLLTLLGVPYATVFAVMAFFFDSIPQVGATLATVFPFLVALSRSMTSALIVVVAVLIFQQVENSFISPRVLSGKLKIPPLITLIAVLAGAKLFGIIGALLAIPLAGMLPVLERVWIAPARPGQRGSTMPLSD
jgi:predicted PurR-regulated permease PerM